MSRTGNRSSPHIEGTDTLLTLEEASAWLAEIEPESENDRGPADRRARAKKRLHRAIKACRIPIERSGRKIAVRSGRLVAWAMNLHDGCGAIHAGEKLTRRPPMIVECRAIDGLVTGDRTTGIPSSPNFNRLLEMHLSREQQLFDSEAKHHQQQLDASAKQLAERLRKQSKSRD
jgi:hypothetical protein